MDELTFFLGLQVTEKDDRIFISQVKYVDEILKKFGFLTMKTASTPMETSKTLIKDENAEDVDVHLYRSMIGSLIYLKGQPKLGLWYPKDSPFDLKAYTDSDYACASLDRKSTTGGCQFLGSRLISWQCKKYALTVNPTIYTLCIKQFWATAKAKSVNGEMQIQALVDRKKVIVAEMSVRRAIQLKDAEGMMVQAQEEGEGSEMPTVPQHTSTINQPSSSKPPKKQKPRKTKKQNTKERVKKLERRNKSRTPGLKRGYLVLIVDEGSHNGMIDDNLMFDIGVFDEQKVEVEKVVSIVEVTTVNATPTTVDELTLAQTLIEIKETIPWLSVMEADYELAQRLQAEEQGELTIEERSKLFVEFMDKRKKHFAKLRAEEIRRKPPTKA
ncbi:hypothetical protein Tco_1410782 [Tanacetum coccineum]